MKKKYVMVLFVLLIIVIASNSAAAKGNRISKKGLCFPITGSTKTLIVRDDSQGGGDWHDSRGDRKHKGIDLRMNGDEFVYSPIYISVNPIKGNTSTPHSCVFFLAIRRSAEA